MSRNRTLIGTAIATVLIIVAWAVMPTAEHADETAATPETTATTPDGGPTPGPTERPPNAHDARLARLDATLARLREEAAERDDNWIVLERIAGGHLERARLTGDWDDFRAAEDALTESFERAPEGAGPFLARAGLNYHLHRFDRIESDLASVEGFAIVRDEQARAVGVMRANVALQQGQYERAEELYEALLEESRVRDALVGLAGHRLAIGRFEEADQLFAEAEELASGANAMSRAWLGLARGLAAREAGALDDALAHYRRGLELMPDWYLLEEHIAEVQAERGEVDEALQAYLDLMERMDEPEFMDAAAALLEAQGEGERASTLRESAHEGHEARIAMYPEGAFGHALGHFLEHDSDVERAVEIAERNRDIRPNGEAWTDLAQAYLQAERIRDARAAIEHVEASPFRSAGYRETAASVQAASAEP